MKIIFVIPDMSWLYDYKMQFPLGILYLSTILKRNNCDVQIFDSNIYPISDIPDADIYAFSAVHDTCESVLYLGATIRDRKDGLLIVGGVSASTESYRYLDVFDCIFIGESEDLIEEFVKDFEKRKVRKFYRQVHPVDVDRCLPDRSLLTDEYIRTSSVFAGGKTYSNGGATSIMFSRGCPSACIFCCSPKLYNRQVRFRDVSLIREEISDIIFSYGIYQFRIQDDTFTLNTSFLERLFEQIKDFSIFYRCSTRADTINKKTVKILYNSGCREVGIGVECPDNDVLKRLGKNETVEQMENAILLLKSHSIEIRCFFMIGLPFDTETRIRKIIDFIEKYKINHATVTNFIPYPGTELYDNYHKFNIKYIKKNHCMNIASHIGFSPNIVRNDMSEKEHIRIMKILYDYLLEKGHIT